MQPSRKTHTRHPRRGFTLVELLVVIVIIAALGSLVFVMAQRGMRSARAATEANNLRQTGTALTSLASDLGYYPTGYNPNTQESWATRLVEADVGENSGTTQLEWLWSPLLTNDIPRDAQGGTVTHFGANPAILTDADPTSTQDPPAPEFRMRPAQLRRPAQQILLASATPTGSKVRYKRADPIMRDMLPLIGGTASSPGEPPQLSENSANASLNIRDTKARSQQYGSEPDFYRFRDGKGRFLFVDGHMQSMTPSDHKERHWAVSY